MLCKVSFLGKQDVKSFNNRVTVVTLKGNLNTSFPIPSTVYNWAIKYLENSRIIFKYTNEYFTISTTGIAKCSDRDTYDSVLGERIAESRAKIALYRFMELLCKAMYVFYKNMIDGECDITITMSSKQPCLYNDYLKYGMLYDREKDHLKYLLDGQSNADN